jgi:hypothetical protein
MNTPFSPIILTPYNEALETVVPSAIRIPSADEWWLGHGYHNHEMC